MVEEKRRKIPYWIFYNLNEKTNDKELILLNYEKSKKNMIKNFTIIDNYDDKCLYLERKNGNT